jgi:CHAT domain-containing protein
VIRVLASASLLELPNAAPARSALLVGSTLGVSSERLQQLMPMYRTPQPGRTVGSLATLPGVSREIASIAATLRSSGYRLPEPLLIAAERDADRLPSVLRERIRGNRIIHIAGHGLFDSTDTMASALLLGGSNERGVIRASDLVALDLRGTELVALSACKTGDVTIRAGQEAFGFVRAVLMAGARHAIVSQWTVDDDATQQWFSLFYQRLAEHEDIERAYQAATVEMSERKTHPYFWAAFTLYARSAAHRGEIASPPTPVPAQTGALPAAPPAPEQATKAPAPPAKAKRSPGPDWRTDVFKN